MKVPKFYYVPNAIILVYICSSIQQANAQLFSVVPISPVGSSPLSSYPPAISSYVKTQHSLDPTESVPTGIMPQVSEVSAMCVAGGGGMHAHISFDRPFSGRIYSIGYGNVHECIYYNGFYTKSVLFSIPLTGCGTRTTKNTRQVVDMIENRVYVQIDKYTLSAGDRKYAFVCELAPTPSDYAGQSGTGFSGTGFGNPIDALQVNVNEIRRRPVSNPSLPFAMPPIQPIVPQNAPKDYLFSPSAKPSALDPSFPKSIQPATLLYANKQWHIPPENVLSNLRNSGHRFAAGPQIPHPNGVGQNGNYFPTVIVPVVPNAGKEIDPFGTSNIFNDNSRNLEKEINDLNNGLLTVDDKELVLGHRSSYSTTPADPFNIGETTHKPAEETTTIRPTTSTSPPTTTEKVESTTSDDRGSVWSVVPLFPKTHEPEEFGDANPLGATLTVGGGTGARKDSPSTQKPVRMYANQKSESELSSLTDVDRSIYLEIRRGGTTPENSSRVDGVVKIGEPIMLVVHARAPSKDPKQYSIFVHSCYSSDGSDASHIQLIDHSGCAVHPQVIGSMQRQHSKYDPKEIIYYFTMKAFKFPINNDVFFFCSVDISPDYNFPELCSENDSTRRRLARRELVPVREAYLNNEADIVHNSRQSTITTDPRIVKASSIKPDEKSGYEVKIVSQNVSVQMEPETWNDTDFVMIKGITEQSLGSITPLSSGNSAKLLTHNFEEIIAGSNAKTIWLSIAIGIAGIFIFLLFREQANTEVFGDGPVVFEWRPGGNHVAVAGTSGLVRIYSRYGDVVEEFSINESVSFVKWDREGELLAVITTTHPPSSASANSSANAKGSTSTAMVLYEFSASHVHTIDISVGAKASSTLVVWSPVQSLLLLGDSRGNIILFNHRTSRKVPIVGKHQRAVRTGDFSVDGSMFGLGSDDQTITISSSESGDTLKTFSCNGEIDCLQFTRFRRIEGLRGGGSATDGRADRAEDFISAIVGKKNLMIVRLIEPENPTNLQFQDRYGNIIMTCWFGNGSVLIGFERGFIVCLSAEKASEVSQEVFSLQEYKGHLAMLCVNTSLGKLYSIGDNLLKIRELNELSEVSDMVDVDSEDKGLVHISASDDGTLTAVSGKSGSFSVYLTKLPVVAAAYQSTIGVLSSLTEVTIYRDGDGQPSLTINVKVEPSLIAVGPEHVVVALNNRAWFYEIRRNSHTMVYEHDYLMTVTKIRLNREFVMAELDGKVHLHKLPLPQTDQEETPATVEWMDSKIFPESGTQEQPQFQDKNTETAGGGKICAADLSEKFLVYTTTGRYILYFSLEHSRTVSDYKHTCQPRAVFAESQGIRLCFLDERHDAYIYSPIDDLLTKIPQTGPLLHYKCCLWETFTIDRDSFVVSDGSSMHVFVVSRNMTKPDQDQILNHIGTVPIPFGNVPVMLSKGIVYCHTHNGRVNTVLLKTHKTDTVFEGKPPHELKEMLQQSLTLKRWRNAWRICDHLKDKASWQVFSHAALEDMNIDLAIRIFRFVGDVGMVWRLEELLYVEDQLTLAGHVTALLGLDYDLADQLFCRSKEPIHALEMRRDIQHWDRALELARQTAPEEIPHISKEYAMQLEFLGKHEEALRHYEQALIEKFDPKLDDEVKVAEREEHNSACKSGIARMSLRVGDLRKGVQTALEIPGRIAKRDCGLILEQLRQFDEAGRLYEAGLFYDRAVASYLRAKDWVKVNELIDQVRSPKILCQYGKILVNEKKYERAYEVYSKARDYENMIALLLKNLNKPEEAVRMAQESRSIEGAKMVAKFFSELGNNESAIEFLVLSQCFQEAYELAEQCDRMDIYARSLESTTVGATENQNKKSVPVPDNIAQLFAQLVDYYTQHSPSPLMAGKFAGMAKNYVLAMHHLTQVNTSGKASSEDEDSAIQLAVEFAAESQDRGLIYKLIDYLLGETDGIPKNPKFLFQFYVRLKMYPEAAKTAIIIAQDQQSKGFYKTAHDLLFGMYRTLTIQKIHIPAEMENNLQLLHSYNIVKGLIRRGDNYTAARLLIRVSDNISQFPMHAVPILTSTVITCTKAGFKASAFKFASQLLQPNYRQKIDDKYKRKIETVVRKSDRNAVDTEGRLSPCPQCTTQMDEFNLTCTECKSTIPYCIVTGRHVVDNDFALCSACSFPGYFSEFNKLISLEENCPMCHDKLGNIIPSNYIDYINSLEIQT